ncbi:MAG TPA: hypothetical protein PLY81_00825 [Chitinophagaceae bacterium]|nr:hypothetical protein [Chitinophagaceae bacterium]HNF28803.1 hypothetical protein [Chitinophagaceae bacterium]HNJ57702.1 hypothetical protein [Chitinophagaceae bacterium]
MAVLKFRIYLEEDDAVYRDIAIKHTQTFELLHFTILKAFEFDSKHAATFYRSNDNWQRGREITFEKYDKEYAAPPLFMQEVPIGNEIKNTNQKFIYEYDFTKGWIFLVELISVNKEEKTKEEYPLITRKEGLGPQQYGTKSLLGDKFSDIEERYDLTETAEGFGNEGDSEDSEIEMNEDAMDNDNEEL